MLAMGEGFVVYSIMDFIVDNYFPVLQELESEVDALEDAIFSRTGPSPIRLASKLIRAGSSTPNACPDGASTSTARSTASANTEFMPGAIPSASDKLGGFAALSGWRKRGRYSSISSCSRPVR
jgi:Mg2+ and Co2+ transporter CorA